MVVHGPAKAKVVGFEANRFISPSGDVVQRQHSANKRQVQLLAVSALLSPAVDKRACTRL